MVRTTATAGESNAVFRHVEKGKRSATRLRALLGQQQLPPPAGSSAAAAALHGPVALTEQILCCFDRVLAELNGGADDAAAAGGRKCKPERGARAAASSKRIRVEMKGTMEDSYLWRKYGQKEIKNSKYPRFYYRCSYKDDHGCTATKQVQQSETDPSVFAITYFGEHTCGRVADDHAAVVVDGNGEDSSEEVIISFGSSSGGAAAAGACAYPWPWSLPELMGEETLPCMDNMAEEELIIDESSATELMGLISSPDLEPNILDLQLGESSFDVDRSTHQF